MQFHAKLGIATFAIYFCHCIVVYCHPVSSPSAVVSSTPELDHSIHADDTLCAAIPKLQAKIRMMHEQAMADDWEQKEHDNKTAENRRKVYLKFSDFLWRILLFFASPRGFTLVWFYCTFGALVVKIMMNVFRYDFRSQRRIVLFVIFGMACIWTCFQHVQAKVTEAELADEDWEYFAEGGICDEECGQKQLKAAETFAFWKGGKAVFEYSNNRWETERKDYYNTLDALQSSSRHGIEDKTQNLKLAWKKKRQDRMERNMAGLHTRLLVAQEACKLLPEMVVEKHHDATLFLTA